jgi:hypothetical protein
MLEWDGLKPMPQLDHAPGLLLPRPSSGLLEPMQEREWLTRQVAGLRRELHKIAEARKTAARKYAAAKQQAGMQVRDESQPR